MADVGVDAFRAGTYKPCTYPVRKDVNDWKEGLREKGLEYQAAASVNSNLPSVSEIMDIQQITEQSLEAIDVI